MKSGLPDYFYSKMIEVRDRIAILLAGSKRKINNMLYIMVYTICHNNSQYIYIYIEQISIEQLV
jgi:hypothetical protein